MPAERHPLGSATARIVRRMTYRFNLQEPIAKGVSRSGLEQIDIAEARLASRDDVPTAIHDARRCLKRLRALLRLIRPALRESAYRRETRRIAAIGRLLAGARDYHVMHQTLTKLESRFGVLPNGVSARLNKLMVNGAGPKSRRQSAQERRLALDGLDQARTFFTRAERKEIAFEHVAEGLERAYRKARNAFREAYRRPSDEAFHGWRKTMQQHWRHMQLLSRSWPEVLGARASEAKELSRLLGDDHDFAVLLAFALDRGAAVLSARDRAMLTRVCRSCQSNLRTSAKLHGDRLLAEAPKELSERLTIYWSTAQHRLALAPPTQDVEPVRGTQPQASATRRRPRAVGGRAQAASRGSSAPKSRRPGQ